MGEDDPVDDLPGDERDQRLGHARQAGGREGEDQVPAVAEHDAPQTPHPAGWSCRCRAVKRCGPGRWISGHRGPVNGLPPGRAALGGHFVEGEPDPDQRLLDLGTVSRPGA